VGKLLSDSLFTSVAFAIQKPFAFLREFVLAGLLGPYYMGLRELIVMLMNYSSYAFIGTWVELYRVTSTNSSNYNNEQLKVNSEEISLICLSTLMSYSLFVSFIITLCVIIFSFIVDYSLEVKVAFYLLCGICLFFLLGNTINYYMIGKAEFKRTTVYESIFVILNTIFTIILAYLFGYLGAILGLFLATIVRFYMFYLDYSKLNIKMEFRLDKFIMLLKNGFNLFINNISTTLYMQIDSLIVILMLGPAALGIYGVAIKINALIYSIYNSAITPLGQRMIETKNDDVLLLSYLKRVNILSTYTVIFPILLIVFITPILIGILLPSYDDAVVIVMVLAPAAFFNIILGPISNYLIAKHKERIITISTVIALLCNIVLNIYFISLGYGLVGVASATSISYGVNYVIISFMSKTHSLVSFFKEIIPLFYMMIFLYGFIYGLVVLPFYLILTWFIFCKDGINDYLWKIKTICLKRLLSLIKRD
jgi:O-antigen/teichoic acid export membrane protein